MSSTNVADGRPPRRPWSLAARLAIWDAASAFLLLLAATVFLYWVLASNLERQDDQFLTDRARFLRALLREQPQDAAELKREVEGEGSARHFTRLYVRVLDARQRTLLETPGMGADLGIDAFPAPLGVDEEPRRGQALAAAGTAYRLLAVRAAVGQSGAETRILQVAFDRTDEEQLLAGYRRSLWLVLGLGLVLCALGGYEIARRGLRPVTEITETARRIRSTTLDERLELAGLPAELSALASTFNEMLDRLEESFSRLARFSADIAHELRTPVNNLRGEAEVALGKPRSPEEYREVLGSCLEECGRLARLIDSLLFLARAESPAAHIRRERVNLLHELSTIRDFYEAAAAEAGVSLAVECGPAATAEVDRTLFQRAVANLVANALQHTPPGGTVTVRGRAENGTVCVEVSDTGRGIPPEHLPHLFDRFYRVDASRTTCTGGVGLGLAIVQGIATLHQGRVVLESEPGRGTRACLQLPTAAPSLHEGR